MSGTAVMQHRDKRDLTVQAGNVGATVEAGGALLGAAFVPATGFAPEARPQR